MKKLSFLLILILFFGCSTTKNGTKPKNVWKAEKATFSYPGSIPPAPKDKTPKK